jgi:hypothetical protein
VNRMHVMTTIQRLALEGDSDADSIYGKIRKALPGTVNNGAGELMSRAECQAFAKQAIHQAQSAMFPVERARLALDIAEGELRADILDGVAALDVSNPRDCRDAFDLHQKVGGSVGEPTCREAIDYLKNAGQDVAALEAKLVELYPAPTEDDDVAE